MRYDPKALHGLPAPATFCHSFEWFSGGFHAGRPFKFFDVMSNLYTRVMTGFYTHRKTVKLRIKLGDDAFWIVPRLWAYVAENQPDGDMSKYSSEEIAMLLGCQKYAKVMLQALKECGFIEENGFIHDWHEHNGYHKKFSERAKKAAEARWSKSPKPPKEVEIESGKGKGETSIATSMPQASNGKHNASLPNLAEVFDQWNKTPNLPKCLVLSDKRRMLLKARLGDPFFVANWRKAMSKASESPFCQGINNRGWRATFEWFISPDAVAKIMEDKYSGVPVDVKPLGKTLAEKILDQL